MLYAALANGSSDPIFDLNDDGSLSRADVTFLVEDILGTRVGDANLDGGVDFDDFLLLAANFGLPGTWSTGDFDGDGTIQFADFLSLADSFGFDAAAALSDTDFLDDGIAGSLIKDL